MELIGLFWFVLFSFQRSIFVICSVYRQQRKQL